ncbi:hypothetical protein M0812_07030 [Anaeramoeba flamelloides]|uniref:Uncharacterized protein n=1 Tax=Anaeramoeba flamelloides TaxID=1746091 RepID=A0AAV8A9B5_9EUKA|nr:hypothetical protein M0812_07030 [Anaeramoeba flamelloides]
MTDLKFKRFRHSTAFVTTLLKDNDDLKLDKSLSGDLCVDKLCSVGKLGRSRHTHKSQSIMYRKRNETKRLGKHKRTRQRIKNKTNFEKVALQGLCLLRDQLFLPDLYTPHNKPTIKKQTRKRSYGKRSYNLSTTNQIVQTKIELELEKPIARDGSFCVKGSKKGMFASPSTYPLLKNLKQQN